MIGANLGIALPFSPATQAMVMPPAQVISLPLAFGQEPLVTEGQAVLAGEIIAAGCGGAAAIHSSIAGVVEKIQPKICHFGRIVPTVVIKNQGETGHVAPKPKALIQGEPPLELLELLEQRGVTDDQGRSLAVVLAARKTPIKTLVISALDREPFLNREDWAVCYQGEQVLAGMRLLQQILQPQSTVIALSEHQTEAVDKVTRWVGRGLRMAMVSGNYPQAQPQLLAELVGACEFCQDLEEAGAVVVSATSAADCATAIYDGRPITHMTLSVSGPSGTVLVTAPLGISLEEVLKFVGFRGETAVLGGRIQGTVLNDLSVPLVGGMGNITLLRSLAMVEETPCIRCGNCAQICPMGLRPYARGQEKNPVWKRCLHCGACQYVCPAGRLNPTKKEVESLVLQ